MGRTRSAKSAKRSASKSSVLASWPVAFAKSRTCRGFTTTAGKPANANAATTARSYPPVASSTMRRGSKRREPSDRGGDASRVIRGRPCRSLRSAGDDQLRFCDVHTHKEFTHRHLSCGHRLAQPCDAGSRPAQPFGLPMRDAGDAHAIVRPESTVGSIELSPTGCVNARNASNDKIQGSIRRLSK